MAFGGKNVVLTGVLNDVGQGCAKDFAVHGAHVVLIDSDAAKLETLRAAIAESGGKASTYPANPCDEDAMAAAAERCAGEYGGVDVLVTCPMDVEVASIEDSSVASWRRVIENNLVGPLIAAKAFLPLLKRAADAAIVHVGSIDGILGNPQVPSYSASKGGIIALTHVMADEFGAFGIRVNCVARAIAIERGGPMSPNFERLKPHTPLGRPGYFDEIGAAARFFASSEASYISGTTLPVDGGRSAITPGTRRLSS